MAGSPQSIPPISHPVASAAANKPPSFFRRLLTPFRLTLLVTLSCIAIESSADDRAGGPVLSNLEHGLGDLRFKLRWQFGLARSPEYVVIVAADEKSIQKIGFWPFRRETYALLIDKLTSAGASAIVFDMGFVDERAGETTGDDLLAAATKRSKRTVQGFILQNNAEGAALTKEDQASNIDRLAKAAIGPIRFPTGKGFSAPQLDDDVVAYPFAKAPLKPFTDAATWFGFFNFEPDDDGVLRRDLLVAQLGGHLEVPSIDVAGFGVACGSGAPRLVTPLMLSQGDPLAYVDIPCEGAESRVPVDKHGSMLLDYQVPWRAFPRVSTIDVLDNQVGTAEIAGKIALVAATAEGTHDLRISPFDPSVPGGITHATALEQMVSGRFLKRSAGVHLLELIYLLTLGLSFGWLFASLPPSAVLPTLVLGLAGSYGLSFGLFLAKYDVISALPLVQLFLMAVLALGDRYFLEDRDRRQIRSAFGHYLSHSVMEAVLADPSKLRLGGDKRELTVLFSDVRGFTSLSERLQPEQLVTLLNQYLTPMTDLVFEHGGTLDKYMGDAIMAFFGAPIDLPDHALRAVRTADDMMKKLAELTLGWKAQGIPALDIGIGISTGPMVVGNMGSENGFRNYTVMGDAVNLGSRLEGTNKVYGTHVILAEETEQQVHGKVAVRYLDAVRVKGKHQPVKIYELLAAGPLPAEWTDLLPDYERGVELYRKRSFAEALAAFERVLAKRPDDKPSKIYIDRCTELSASPPPADWDGVFDLLTK